MLYRPVPTYETSGLAIPPRQRDCIGEECPVAAEIGSCFVDRHHLYFPRFVYLADGAGSLMHELRTDPHSQVDMARCRHNSESERSQHKLYDGTPYPDEDAVATYLDESHLLTTLGVKVDNLAKLVDDLMKTDLHPEERRSKTERLQRTNEEFRAQWPRTKEIEVMPTIIYGGAITEIGARRNSLKGPIRELIAA